MVLYKRYSNSGGIILTFKNLLISKAVVCFGFAVLFLLVPVPLFKLFGVSLTIGGSFPAREYGAALAGTMMLTWFARDMVKSPVRRPILLHLFVYDAIGLVVTVIYLSLGVLNPLGLGPAAIYLFFAIGSGYLLLKKQPEEMGSRVSQQTADLPG